MNTERVDDKTAAPSVGRVKVHKDVKKPGQTDSKSGISYKSLIRQIEAWLKKEHSGDENLPWRTSGYVSPTLRGTHRAHYNEKNSTELYTELDSSVQSAKETGSEFFMRTMDLKIKILFASLENSDELKYSPDLVYKLFARTVQTGFRDQILRQEMMAILTGSTKRTLNY